MAKQSTKPVRPGKPVRQFRHKVTGAIHEADGQWAPIMATRNDLEEITSKKETSDDEKAE